MKSAYQLLPLLYLREERRSCSVGMAAIICSYVVQLADRNSSSSRRHIDRSKCQLASWIHIAEHNCNQIRQLGGFAVTLAPTIFPLANKYSVVWINRLEAQLHTHSRTTMQCQHIPLLLSGLLSYCWEQERVTYSIYRGEQVSFCGECRQLQFKAMLEQ